MAEAEGSNEDITGESISSPLLPSSPLLFFSVSVVISLHTCVFTQHACVHREEEVQAEGPEDTLVWEDEEEGDGRADEAEPVRQ